MWGQPLHPAYLSSIGEVFPDSDPIEVVDRDIRLLTCILSGVRDGPPYTSPTHTHGSDLSTWRHLAYILQIPSDTDAAAAKAVAVTGHISSLGVVYTVASQGDVHGAFPNALRRVPAGAEDAAERLLSKDLNEIQNVEFPQHVQDVHAVFNYIVSGRHDKTTFDVVNGLAAFVVRRNYSKILKRIDHADYAWGRNPLRIIRDYYRESPEARATARSGRVALSGPSVRSVLALYRIEPASDPESPGRTEYDFGPANVLIWTDVLVGMLSYLECDMRLPYGGTPQPPPIMRIVSILQVLNTLFRSNIVDLLLDPPVLSQLVCAAIVQRAAHRQGSQGTREPDDHIPGDPETAMGKRIVLYLQSLAAPYTAAKELVSRASKFRKHASSVTMYHAEMKPRDIDVEQADVEEFKARFSGCGSRAEQDSAGRYFQREDVARRLSLEFLDGHPSVHAEAALMALASACASGRDSRELPSEWADMLGDASDEMFQSTEIPIGTSEKCCRCCELLRARLQAHNSNISFQVSGSHATILPWAPPPVGVPRPVLVEIRRELLVSLGKQVAQGVSEPDDASDDEGTGEELLAHMKARGSLARVD